MGAYTSPDQPTMSAARQQRRQVRSSAPLLLRPLVPSQPSVGFLSAAVLIGIAILISALKPATATLVASIPLLIFGLYMLAGAVWNEEHHADVSGAIGTQRRAAQASMRRHPVLWLTLLPLAAAGRAVERLSTDGSSHGLALILATGGGMWLFGLIAVGTRIRRARATNN